MAYTQEDLDNIKAAIIELARGQRVVRITYSDGKTLEYQPLKLQYLKDLAADIQAQINRNTGKPSYFYATTSKGI